jgi:hypothetical protein
MQALSATGVTDPEGTLTLSLPVGQPNAAFDAIIVLQVRSPTRNVDPWAAINEFREKLAASGLAFSESAEMIREDRER